MKPLKRSPLKHPSRVVRWAVLTGNKQACSALGRAGAKAKREIAELDKQRFEHYLLACAEEMREEANEHICPID